MRNILLILIFFASLMGARRSSAQVILKTDTITVPCSSTDTFLVPLRVLNFTDVGSFQFTLSWNPQNLDYIATGPLQPEFTGGPVNFGYDTSAVFVNSGKLTFNWTKFGGGTVPDGSIIFQVAFVRLGGPYTSVGFSNDPVTVEVTDADGNEVPWMVMNGGVKPVDTEGPSITCPANVTVPGAGPTPVPGIAPASLTDNCGIPAAGFNVTGATTFSAPNDPDASGTAFNLGQSTVTYTATDVGGQTASCSFTVTVEPSLTDDFTLIAGNVNGSCNTTLVIPITTLNFDSLGSLQFSLGWDPQVLDYQTVSNFNPALTLAPSNFGVAQVNSGFLSFNWTTGQPLTGGTTLPDGAVLFTLEFTVSGAAGSNSSIAFGDFPSVKEAYQVSDLINELPIVTINGQTNISDNVAPVLVCPQSVAVPADPGFTTATVNGLAPLALSDNCAGVVGQTYTATGATPGTGNGPANGIYNAGTTTVTYTATDASGNTASCSFTVVVDAGQTLNLYLDTVAVDCQGAGDTVSFQVTVENFVDIWGLQFSVNWDETVLKWISVSNLNPALNLDATSFIGYVGTQNGILRFLDGDGSFGWPDLADGDTLFTINFVVLDLNATTDIAFLPPFDAVNGSFASVPLSTSGGFFQSADQSPPSITCPTVLPVDAMAGLCSANVQIPSPVADDACSGIASVAQVPPGNTFNTGTTQVFFTATDNAGNSAVCSVTVTVNDVTPPQIAGCPTDINVNASGANCEGIGDWTAPTAVDACGQATVQQPNYAPGSSFPVGSTTVIYTAVDDAGNSAQCSFSVTVKDLQAPVIVCPDDVTTNAVSGSGNCSGIGEFADATGTDNCDQALDFTSDYGSGEMFPVGTTTVTFEAEDDYGNTATCQFTVTVLDASAPILSCPPSVVDTSDANVCGSNVDWAAPAATDDCDIAVIVTADPVVVPGAFFPSGTTTVTYTATDNSGNTSTCSFSITVVETVPPVLSACPPLTIIDLPPGDCDTVVNWTPPTATDNCDLDTIITNIAPGSIFVSGQTTVTYTAIDAAGNTATCSFDVYVIDQIPPVITSCPPSDTVNVSGSCGVVYPWTLPGVTDNCDIDPEITATPMPGDTFNIGLTNVVIYAEDNSGNRDTCAFSVLVIGSSVPGWMNTPDDVVLNIQSGCDTTYSWQPPTAMGFCQDPVITSTHQPGDTFGAGVTTVTYTATDMNGIQINTSFTVTVHESSAPTLDCPESIVASVGAIVITDPSAIIQEIDTVAGCDGARLFFSSPIGIDNCPGVEVAQTAGPVTGEVFPVGVTTVSFVATDASGNTALCSYTVTVAPLLPVDLSVAPLVACMEGEIDTLTAFLIPGASYTWTGPDGSTIADTDNQILVIAGGGNSGTYTVSADINGCPTPDASAQVVVASALEAVNDTFTIAAGTLDTLPVLSNDIFIPSDGGITDFFPDNNTDLVLLDDGTFSYAMGESSFTFTYQLCSKTCPDLCSEATVTVQLKTEGCQFIPNIFTPNHDGDHDTFVIPCLEGGTLRNSSIVIYNQWGDKVYEAEPYQNAWDGTLNGEAGKDLPDGTYFYIFKPRPNDPPQKGFVEIFR